MDWLQHLFHNDHGELLLLTTSLSGGFVLSDVARRARRARRARAWLWCRCPGEHREFSEVGSDARLGGWHYSRCSACGRTWLHFRDFCTRVSSSNPVLQTKTWRRSWS